MAESLNLVVEQDQAGLWRVTSPNITGLSPLGIRVVRRCPMLTARSLICSGSSALPASLRMTP